MTREEAIKELKILKEDYWDDDGYGHETKQYDDAMFALDMAIKALSQEPTKREIEREYLFQSLCEDFKKLQAENDDLRKRLEQEPCEKCVYSTKDGYCQYDDISETIPPLEPCETCGYAEGSPFCLQYCPYDAEKKKEQKPIKPIECNDYTSKDECAVRR